MLSEDRREVVRKGRPVPDMKAKVLWIRYCQVMTGPCLKYDGVGFLSLGVRMYVTPLHPRMPYNEGVTKAVMQKRISGLSCFNGCRAHTVT